MGAVFISYRRGDSEGQARALYVELEQFLGKESIFMDVDSIALGRDFRQVLHERLETCDVLLALIGPNWLDAKDANGARRLESPTDFVRQEISAALQRNIAVTPVLLQGAGMPSPERLPDELKDLAFRNGFELSHTRWESDVRELIRRLDLGAPKTGIFPRPSPPAEPASSRSGSSPVPARSTSPAPSPSVQVSVTPPAPSPRHRSFLPLVVVTAILVAIAALAWMYFSRGQSSSPPTESASSPETGGSASQPKPEREQRPASGERRATPVPVSNTLPASAPAPASPKQAARQPFIGYHHLTSMFMESQNKCLESGDGSGSSIMNSCDNVSGQLWSIKPARNGYYVLLSEFQASNNKCFDSGTLHSTAAMRTCDGSPGQAWKLVADAAGYYRLQSQSMEPQNGCLESNNGSYPSEMNACGNYSGQYWKILDQ